MEQGCCSDSAIAALFGMNYAGRTAVAVEVGMQNSGLAVALAAANFAGFPLATLPGALFSAWQNISGALFAAWRRRARNDDELLSDAADAS